MITPQQIHEAYREVEQATINAYHAVEKAMSAKLALETARGEALTAGTVEGKNEAQREAHLRQMLDGEYARYEAAEGAARWQRHLLELATIRRDQLKMQLRLLEAQRRD